MTPSTGLENISERRACIRLTADRLRWPHAQPSHVLYTYLYSIRVKFVVPQERNSQNGQ